MKLVAKLIVLFLFCSNVQATNVEYTLDIKNLVKNRAKVSVTVFDNNQDTIRFVFPKTVPGTYSTLDYGKYIEKLEAFDSKGIDLKVIKLNKNVFKIFPAKDLKTITYWVKGSWENRAKKDPIFEPAGTHISKNISVVNTGGFFGYILGNLSSKVKVNVIKPSSLFGSSSMEQKDMDLEHQSFFADNYRQLVDSPILFCKPDTASFFVGETKIQISCYHQNGRMIAPAFQEKLKPSMEAIKNFLGKLPVKNYSFLIYIKDYSSMGLDFESDKIPIFKIIKNLPKLIGKGFGALEHNQSSFYYLPDFGSEKNLLEMFESTAIHEFMHIITPLNLHSREIGEFNFFEPKMSKHLWLYEGVTEYYAGIIRAKNALLDTNEYLQKVLLREKIIPGERFPFKTMSFTQMSKNVLEKPYKNQYGQVYIRGAAMAAMLDLEIMNASEGRLQLKDVMQKLIAAYGKDRSFDDDTFFEEFTKVSGIPLNDYFLNYIEGNDSIPYQKFLDYAGVRLNRNITKEMPLPINKWQGVKAKKKFTLSSNPKRVIKNPGSAKLIGLKKGDVFYEKDIFKSTHKANGEYLPLESQTKLKIFRNGKEMILEFNPVYSLQTVKYEVINSSIKTEKQKRIYQKWFSN